VRFTGWPAEAIDWFLGLEADNSRAYFQAHRDVYDRAVRGPMEALLAEVTEEFGEGKVFRPNRDIRFSADKTPYKDHTAASIHREEGGGYYVYISAQGMGAAGGYYGMAPDQIERYRRAVADDHAGAALEEVLAAIGSRYEVGSHDPLKTVPRGYPRDHPRAHLLRYKDLYVTRHNPPAKWLATRKALDRVVETWRAADGMLRWFDHHVGPSNEPNPPHR
jgi:uncharacterized protein (TIGR02453 family)